MFPFKKNYISGSQRWSDFVVCQHFILLFNYNIGHRAFYFSFSVTRHTDTWYLKNITITLVSIHYSRSFTNRTYDCFVCISFNHFLFPHNLRSPMRNEIGNLCIWHIEILFDHHNTDMDKQHWT